MSSEFISTLSGSTDDRLDSFAGAERDFGPPFRADLAGKMLKSLQLMMDRLKEARYTIGTSKVPDIITREFSQRLSPYRRRNIKLTKASLHTCAAALASKAPLPGETPARMYLQSAYCHSSRFCSVAKSSK